MVWGQLGGRRVRAGKHGGEHGGGGGGGAAAKHSQAPPQDSRRSTQQPPADALTNWLTVAQAIQQRHQLVTGARWWFACRRGEGGGGGGGGAAGLAEADGGAQRHACTGTPAVHCVCAVTGIASDRHVVVQEGIQASCKTRIRIKKNPCDLHTATNQPPDQLCRGCRRRGPMMRAPPHQRRVREAPQAQQAAGAAAACPAGRSRCRRWCGAPPLPPPPP